MKRGIMTFGIVGLLALGVVLPGTALANTSGGYSCDSTLWMDGNVVREHHFDAGSDLSREMRGDRGGHTFELIVVCTPREET